jgi:hypothetical protein
MQRTKSLEFSFLCDFKIITMLKKRIQLLAAVVAGLFLIFIPTSCDNELRINAPYEVVPVLYGILDFQQDTNWVRIGRSYQGGDLGAAGGLNHPDSIYMGPLKVLLLEFVNNNRTRTIVLDRDEGRRLADGPFTGAGFHLYRTTTTLLPQARYTIEVYEDEKLLMSASTPMVTAPPIREPRPNQSIALSRLGGQQLQWEHVPNARIYQSFLRLHYIEVARPGYDSIEKILDLNLPTQIANNITGGGSNVGTVITLDSYVNFLRGNLNSDVNTFRLAKHFDLHVTAGEDQLATYISVRQPATGIVQDKPEFTNVNGGVGIFSSRTTIVRERINIAQPTLDSLNFGIVACGLRFSSYQGLPSPAYCFCDPTSNQERICHFIQR